MFKTSICLQFLCSAILLTACYLPLKMQSVSLTDMDICHENNPARDNSRVRNDGRVEVPVSCTSPNRPLPTTEKRNYLFQFWIFTTNIYVFKNRVIVLCSALFMIAVCPSQKNIASVFFLHMLRTNFCRTDEHVL